MDGSQSSDIFSQSSINMNNSATINEESCQLLFTKIKAATSKNVSEKIKLSEHFNLVLEDCSSFINQCFNLIVTQLDSTAQIKTICSYIENAVSTLQLLSNLLKNVIQKIAIECHIMKNFPTSTGSIILLVFSHCKDSECIYGSQLHNVEKQLKDLFRSCHELQLTYLMALGKLFIFDLTDKEEQDILIETMEINLKIGELAQALDVKTMAEQWKAYTMICEKYSNFLLDKDIYNNCTKLLASAIENNLKTALEAAEEDKIVMRSLKVGNFSLKILLKIALIFKECTCVEYDHIVEFIHNLCLCSCNYYEVTENKTSGFVELLKAHLSIPLEALINQMVTDEKFLKVVVSPRKRDCNTKLLESILVIISVIKSSLHKDISTDSKMHVIDNIFSLLPYSYIWSNMHIKFNRHTNRGVKQTHGLYEQLLIHTTVMSFTMSSTEYQMLENYLYEAVLGTDFCSAVFSTNLWISLCSNENSELQINVLKNLIKTYKRLESHPYFIDSAQEINLSNTIETFYKTLECTEKQQIVKQFNIQDSKNIGIWCSLKIRSLPENLKATAQKSVIEKLINASEDIDSLMQYMKLASTCSYDFNSKLEDFITRCWCKACPECSETILCKNIDFGSLSYYKYVENLVLLTDSYTKSFENGLNLNKILHIISRILHTKNVDLTVLLLKTFCNLLVFQYEFHDELNTELLIKTLEIYTECDLQKHFFATMLSHEVIYKFITPFLEDPSLEEIKDNFLEYTKLQDAGHKNELGPISDYKFYHKCLESNSEQTRITKTKSNFDIEIDSLFEDENEPVNKKAKLDTDTDNLIFKLENDVSLLLETKENLLSSEHKNRLKNVYNKLGNILF